MLDLEPYFDTAFAAPDGIKKLRELILTLAMQGKLVEQDPNDPPASELLKEIEAEKQRLIQEKKIKALKPLPAITPEEVPYELPEGWEWVRLGNVVLSMTGGGTPSKNNPAFWNGSIPWASVKDLNVETYLDVTIDHISDEAIKASATNLIPQNRVIICTRMGLGKIAINRVPVTINQDLKALELSSYINQMFFFKKYKDYKIIGKGVTVHGIRQEELLNLLFPLPPLPEQQRIVERIDQLMARCDELEALRTQHSQQRLTLQTAALRPLLNSTNPEQFADAWQFVVTHFADLYGVRANVQELRKAILQLAIMGKLVEQDPNDPPASKLLKEIEAEKQRLIKEKKIKVQKPLPAIKHEEVPFEVPEGWEWVRLENIVTIKGGKRVDNGYKLLDKATPYVYIRVSDMKLGTIDDSDLRYLDEDMHLKIKNHIIKKEDIYMTIVGATIGKCGLVPEKFDGMNLTENAARLILFSNLNKVFLLKCLESNFCQNQFIDKTKQVGVQKMALIRLASTLIPLPPLPEQQRIVAKIDQLMALCDQLEQSLDAQSDKQGALLNALMAV